MLNTHSNVNFLTVVWAFIDQRLLWHYCYYLLYVSVIEHADRRWSYVSSYSFFTKVRRTRAKIHHVAIRQVPFRLCLVSWSRCWQLLWVFTEAVDTNWKDSAMVNIFCACVFVDNVYL